MMERFAEMDEQMDQLDQVQETPVPEFALEKLEDEGFAPSMEVQAQEIADAFMDIESLQFENWENLSIDERVEALQELENKVAEIAHRPPMDVNVEELDPGTAGYFDGKQLVIAEHDLALNDKNAYKEVLNTLLHEGRHAYQNYNLDVKVVEENQELVDSWKVNLAILGYENDMVDEMGFWRYYAQPIEVDARAYADAGIRAMNL